MNEEDQIRESFPDCLIGNHDRCVKKCIADCCVCTCECHEETK